MPLSVNHAVILMRAANATLDRSGDLNIFIIVCVKTTSTAKNAIYTKKMLQHWATTVVYDTCMYAEIYR